MNLLSNDEKTAVNQAMLDLFDTFKRDEQMRFYKPNEEEIIILLNDFNADLEEYHNPNVTRETQYMDFDVRVIYPKRENTLFSSIEGGSNLNIKGLQELGIVNIQVKDEEAYNYMKDTIRFTFDGDKYEKATDIRKIGVLGAFNVYQITLKKVN